MPVDKKFEADGVTINKEKALAMIEQYNTPEKVAAGLEELKATWDRLLSVINVDTPDDKVNRMVNIWNQYQCMVTFNLSRSASYFESGIGRGMGFRDSNQDILGFVHQIPTVQDSVSSTSLLHSFLTAAAIISISLLQRRATLISAATSQTTHCG